MLKYFRVKQEHEKIVPDLGAISISLLERDAALPFTIRQLNNLPEEVKRRLYRGLLPSAPSSMSPFVLYFSFLLMAFEL